MKQLLGVVCFCVSVCLSQGGVAAESLREAITSHSNNLYTTDSSGAITKIRINSVDGNTVQFECVSELPPKAYAARVSKGDLVCRGTIDLASGAVTQELLAVTQFGCKDWVPYSRKATNIGQAGPWGLVATAPYCRQYYMDRDSCRRLSCAKSERVGRTTNTRIVVGIDAAMVIAGRVQSESLASAKAPGSDADAIAKCRTFTLEQYRGADAPVRSADRYNSCVAACNAGDGTLCQSVAVLLSSSTVPPDAYRANKDKKLERKFLTRACDLNNYAACAELGRLMGLYMNKWGATQAQMLSVLKKSCDGGFDTGCFYYQRAAK